MSFYRTPSPLEFSYIGMDTPADSIMVNQFLAQGKGRIDRQKLENALRKATDVNPGMRTRLRGLWGWRYWDDQGAYPSVEEIDAPEWDGMSSEHCPRLGEYIDVRNDPLCQVSIINAKQDVYLLFRTHHAVTDGRGAVHFIKDAFRIMRGEEPIGSTSRLTEWDIARREERPPRPVVEGNCLRVTQFAANPEERGCRWQRFIWNGDKNKLAAKILYGLAQMAWANNGDGKVLLRLPSDLRRYMKDEEGFTIANCTGALDIELKPDTSLNQIRSQIIKSMRQKEDLSPFLDVHKYGRWVPASMFRVKPEILRTRHESGRYRMTGTVSYLGDVDLEPFTLDSYQPVTLFGVPIAFEANPMFVGAASQGDRTGIIVGIPRALATQQQLAQFCQEFSDKLHSLK